ncbi:hypothetical protein N7468_002504 [Penicillium chermesinum]|uniref:UDENN domain-containing protein n=1 Tax=Penicillium chermesinum TaxID=63820 RepID=A0A9W9TXL6_9EURO|nr:uncharacterized protein N7468_002504 [Penicillium chermesinum]KAJ5247521.1 hypothetical protein N7468_002504 [Penicillium chermesinum]
MPVPKHDPIVLVIDFHHARGPEIEHCISDEGTNPAVENDWSLLPFMALSDGAHLYETTPPSPPMCCEPGVQLLIVLRLTRMRRVWDRSTEEFSYFTLRQKETPGVPARSLFGIACSRQIDSKLLINRPPEVTRSTVQKAVVVVTDSPQRVGQLREKLSVVTSAWFAQRDFSDIDILKKFREGLVISLGNDESKDQNLGLSLREMIHEFKYQTLVLFKGLLLQPKMLFFGTRCERLCMIQFSLISLIPGLINSLEDCADPSFNTYEENVEKPTSLKTSDRSSLLAYMGLPLQIFGKGSMFGPYTPLQQLDLLADDGTKSYVVGSTNSLLLQQKDRYSDILINLDEDTINISSPTLRSALALSVADRRWIDLLTQIVNETWVDEDPSRPKTLGFMGSEEFIRLQFEEYLLALLSSMKYHEELTTISTEPSNRSRAHLQTFNIEGDPALDFNVEFLYQWQKTPNYALFSRLTSDALLYSITEPKHPSAGGLTIEDIQRRLSQQVADLHLDERVREGREALNRQLAAGQKKVSAAFNSFWSDIETMREAQKKRNEEKAALSQRTSIDTSVSPPTASAQSSPSEASGWWQGRQRPSIDLSNAQTTMSAASQKAGSYLSSWSSWASEKRKEWQDRRASPSSGVIPSPSTPSLPAVTEAGEADRERRDSISRHSEDGGSLTRSLSRRKRWSNIILRRDSGEFSLPKLDDNNTSDSDVPFPRSPLSRGLPAYEAGEQVKDEVEPLGLSRTDKGHVEQSIDADGFSSVVLTPNEGLRVDLDPNQQAALQKLDAQPEVSVTALPGKENESPMHGAPTTAGP